MKLGRRHLARLSRFLLASLFWVSGMGEPAHARDGQPSVTILSSDDHGIKIQVLPPSYPQSAITLQGKTYLRFDGAMIGEAEERRPLLPTEGILLGIPPGAKASLEILNSAYEVIPNQLIAPAPALRLDEERNVHEEFVVDEAAYSRDVWYPSRTADLAEITQLRHQRVAKILVYPFQYNPATRQLKKLVSLTLNLRFTYPAGDGEPRGIQPAGPDPHFEEVYKSLLANYEEAKNWRAAINPLEPNKSFADSLRDWFDPGRPYLRLLIAKDGLYKLTQSDIAATGVDPGAINPRTLKLYNRGLQIPLHVVGETDGVFNAGDFLEFYARRNYGRGEFYDAYTDTNVYWLTWGGPDGLRMATEATDTTGTPAAYFIRNAHFEQDLNYYFGHNEAEIIQPEKVPGEGWYWRDFSVGSPPQDFPFQIDAIHRGSGVPARLKVRFHGMSATAAISQHRATVALNGVNLGTVSWTQNTESVFEVSFHDSILRAGNNTLRITPTSPGSPNISRFYVDWFEVAYPSSFTASSDELTFFSRPAVGGAPVRYTISNFQSSAIDVYNLSDARKLIGGRIVPSPDGTFTITFRDTGSVSKRYIVVSESQKLKPAKIERKQFKDIRTNPSGADFIIITHGLFKGAADRLAAYRSSQLNIRTAVVDIQDIYDEFNYGIFSPEAIKPFLRFAYDRWTRPAPAFVLLLGDASWDFKFNRATTVKKNFVPAYGNPPTDNWYVAFDSARPVLPSMLIGRIPAESVVQVEGVVDKLVQYDRTPLGDWSKSFLFITGGNTDAEKRSFNSMSELFIANYVSPAPVGGIPYRVYKTTDAIIDGENKQLIQDIISGGTLFLNFIGHSGGRYWGVDPGDPRDLRNTDGRFVFVSSVSCNVAAFADPVQNVLTEEWLFANQRAAIAGWAGSSLGYVSIGRILTDSFLRSMARDTVRNMGRLTTIARIDLWKISPPSPLVISSVALHPLLGDPVADLALPIKPDLVVKQSDIFFDPAVPTELDSVVKIQAKVRNFGLVPRDSVEVKLTDSFSGMDFPIGPGTYRLPPVRTNDSILIAWDVVGKSGRRLIRVQVDPANKISEVSKANNRVDVPIQVFASRLLPIRPVTSSIVSRGPQVLEVTSPVRGSTDMVKYFFEVDTTLEFNSDRKLSSPPVDAGVLTTRWTTPNLINDGLYYWRTRSYDGRDSGAWVISNFLVSSESVPSSIIRRSERYAKQFMNDQRFQVDVSDSGVTVARSGGFPIYIRSLGYRNNMDRDYYSIIRVGTQEMTAYWWVTGNGFVVAVINGLDGRFEYRAFDVSRNPALADSMARFLQNTPADRYVAITVVFDGHTNNNEALYSTLERMGARDIRRVRPGESWAFLAQKSTGFSQESYSKDGVAEINYLIPSFYNLQVGTITTGGIGPARRWRSLSWSNDAPSGTNISLRILDARTNAVIDTLPKNVLTFDLTSVDVRRHPVLKLQALLRSDFGTATPILKSWSVDYEGPADLAIVPQLIRVSRDSVLEGEHIDFTAEVYNIGYSRADSVRVNFYTLGPGSRRQLFGSVLVVNLEAERSETVVATLNTAGRRGPQTLVVELDSRGLPELYDINNVATRTFHVRRDTVPPKLEVTFDGLPIISGDYVSPQPNIVVALYDNSPLPIQDTASVTLRLNNRRIPYAGNPQITFDSTVSGNKKVEVRFKPVLERGGHTLLVDARDASNNLGVTYRVDFTVETTPRLLNVYNYPNPFAHETEFTFNLTGADIPDDLTIKIYTVAGRLIRTIEVPVSSLRYGFNRIRWDGRDNDGNEVANGVYFYSMVLKSGESTVVQTQRMAKVR